MTPHRLLLRKIAYVCLVGVLMVPLTMIGRLPAGGGRGPAHGAGRLATLREEHRLGQQAFGDIDPAGETMKLAMFGMDAVASLILWSRVQEHRKKENWDALEATLNQLVKVMPHYVGVWRFQAHNIAVNLASEFDDYRDKYEWVKKGIEFLKQGYRYNQREPRLLWDIGWFIGQRIGRSDHRVPFRRMYREEHGIDCWLAAKQWMLEAERLVDTQGVTFRGMSPLLFHAQPAMSQIYYAIGLEEDGVDLPHDEDLSPDERRRIIEQHLLLWRQAWRTAADDWRAYGERPFDISDGVSVRMNELEPLRRQRRELLDGLYALVPEHVEARVAERRGELLAGIDQVRQVPAFRRTTGEHELFQLGAALDQPPAARTPQEQEAVLTAVARHGLLSGLLDRVGPEHRIEVRRLADQIALVHYKADLVETNREFSRYDVWLLRCTAEATDDALAARMAAAEAQWERDRGRLVEARRHYERAFRHWVRVFAESPDLWTSLGLADELLELAVRYRNLLVDEMDEVFPAGFVFEELLRFHMDEEELEAWYRGDAA